MKQTLSKVHSVYICKPPLGTIVINKLHAPNYIKNNKDIIFCTDTEYNMYNSLSVYGINKTNTDTPFILCGTVGEKTIISTYELCNYTLYDGSVINTEDIKDWVLCNFKNTHKKFNVEFIPLSKKIQIGNQIANNPKTGYHGNGDFIVDGKLVQGEVFSNTYDNRTWLNEVKPSSKQITLDTLPKLDFTDISKLRLREKIESYLLRAKNTQVRQLKLRVKKNTDTNYTIVPDVIKNYKNEIEKAYNKTFDRLEIDITISDSTITILAYNILSGTKNKVYKINLPNDEKGLYLLDKHIQLYLGLMGYIPNGLENYFTKNRAVTKYEHDGVLAYTVSSSGINRKLRLQDYRDDSKQYNKQYERNEFESQRLYRVIDGLDSYMNNSKVNSNLKVYRGVNKFSISFFFPNITSPEELIGKVMPNTGYTSTSINLFSTLLFANPPWEHNDIGYIFSINIPVGISADYINNIAGWEEQFEVLLDRKYDILIKEPLIKFGDGKCTYYVFDCDIVQHVPFSKIPKFINTKYHKDVTDIDIYDKNGRINFDYLRIRGDMKETFNMLRKSGIMNIQYLEDVPINNTRLDFIIARGKEDEDYFIDYGFNIDSDNSLINIYIIKSKKAINSRSYWVDVNRNNAETDKNFVWESYIDKGSLTTEQRDSLVKDNVIFEFKRQLLKTDTYSSTILNYMKYNKDITILPLQDIARYFYVVFKTTVTTEGYYIYDSDPVNRVGDPNNENDGYVPLRFRIDGDNDDNLTLMMRMDRDTRGKVQLEYRGMSENKRVKETSKLAWNSFDVQVMEKFSIDVLYVFAKKLNLNHTGKLERVFNLFEKRLGYKIAKLDDTTFKIVDKIKGACELKATVYNRVLTIDVLGKTQQIDYNDTVNNIYNIIKVMLGD